MKKIIKICLWCFGSLLALILLLFGVAMFLLTPERLTPIVKSVAQEYLNASVDFKSVEVSLFKDFPLVEVSLKGAMVVSYALAEPDTLVSFKDFSISINAIKLIKGQISIRSVSITEPWISARVDTTGKASWDIVKPIPDTETDTTSSSLDLRIRSIKFLGESKIELTDNRNSTYIRAVWSDLQVLGRLTNDVKKFGLSSLQLRNLKATITARHDSIHSSINVDTLAISRAKGSKLYSLNLLVNNVGFKAGGKDLARDLGVALKGNVAFSNDTLQVDNLRFAINDISSTLNGLAIIGDSTINSDIKFTCPAIKLTDVVALVPTLEHDLGYKIESNISIGINAKIDGTYNLNSGSLPDINLNITSPNGYLAFGGVKEQLEKFTLAASLDVKQGKASMKLHNIELQGAGISLQASGHALDLLSDPLIDATIKSTINTDILLPIFPTLKPHIEASGTIGIDGNGKFRLSQLSITKLAATTIEAQLSFHRFKFRLSQQQVQGLASGNIRIGTSANKLDTTMAVGLRVIGAYINMDTMVIRIGDAVNMSGKGITAWATTAASRYSSGRKRVHPFRGSLSAKRFTAITADSSIYRTNKLVYDFTVTPSPISDTIPILRSTLKAGSMAIKSGLDRAVMRKVEFTAKAQVVPVNKNAAKRREHRLDSLQTIYPNIKRDSLMSHLRSLRPAAADEMESGDIDLKADGSLLGLLYHWKAEGKLAASQIRVITPYIPLRTTIEDVNISFNNNRIDLHSFCLGVGRSHLDMTGSVSNLQRVLAGRGTLKAKLSITSDTIDFTQIIQAINSGIASHANIASAIDSTGAESEEHIEQIIEQQTSAATTSNLIIIPKNIDLNAKMLVGHAIYGGVIMDSLTTELISRNRVLQIKQLSAASNIGQMSLEAVYATRSMRDISTGFDLELHNVKVAELLDLVPAIDTLLPMLASFEGIVDCKIAAKAGIDSAMNIIIPSLDAAASISGRDLVLLDGETFTEISKMLKFKNKQRNLVDSISVQMLIKDSKIEIFPFILSLDRYKTAVSGVQNLDMSFDYHISVIKSIVPFRLGINIYGNLDDWKFKLVKAKYKNENIPSYVTTIDTVRINLRNEIENIFRNPK